MCFLLEVARHRRCPPSAPTTSYKLASSHYPRPPHLTDANLVIHVSRHSTPMASVAQGGDFTAGNGTGERLIALHSKSKQQSVVRVNRPCPFYYFVWDGNAEGYSSTRAYVCRKRRTADMAAIVLCDMCRHQAVLPTGYCVV